MNLRQPQKPSSIKGSQAVVAVVAVNFIKSNRMVV